MGIVWSTAAAILGSIGGGGLIVGVLVKWYSNIIADKLSKQYAHSLSEEMEKYKMKINKSLYVRQKHFDLELSIYRTLMNGLIEMTESAYLLFPCYDELPEELVQQKTIFENRGNRAVSCFNKASLTLFKNAPFVDRNIYQKVLDLRKVCLGQIQCFKMFKIDKDAEKNRSVLSTEYRECLKVSSSIVEKRDSIIEDIRNYLQTLENNYATKKP